MKTSPYISKHIIRIIFCLICVGLSQKLTSQNRARKKQAKEIYLKDSIRIYTPKRIYPQIALDNRKSFHRTSPVDVQGIYTGILFKSRYKFGIGYYEVSAEGHANKKINESQVQAIRNLDLYYATFNFEYLVLDKRHIKMGFPVNIGFGYSDLKIYDENKARMLYHSRGNFTPLSVAWEVTLKPMRWFGVTGSIGYRKLLSRSEPRIDFEGLFYSFGLAIDLKEIIKDVRLVGARKRYKKAMHLK
ncbi:MAG: hypothetical protein V4565_05600 [Bacteroidota bacterium]